MPENRITKKQLSQMSRKQLERQVELLQQEVMRLTATSLKWYQAYDLMAAHFESLPDDIKPVLDTALKRIGA
ncbi:MAG: hypothetical protein Unbinned5123contig1000_38 [Prokaryotic dsDNA virus sp.]|nr:MAG: hypothetical protein Unbinned5123contig1000_38 [Prokaryotic dsDNA virus sp.]